MSKAAKGDTVKVHYTGRLADGEVFDSSEDREPLEFDLGQGQVIEGFEEAILGMEQGDKKTVEISVDKAYGPVNPEYILKAPRDQMPQDLDPQIGMQLQMPVPDGPPVVVTITEFDNESVTLDANPPLAGKDLIFDLELVGVLKM